MREAEIKHEIRLRLGSMPDVVLWNNSVGMKLDADHTPVLRRLLAIHGTNEAVSLIGATLSDRVRRFPFGLCKGSSDLVGIGPGGRFLGLEVKTATGKPTQLQLQFIELVNRMGGVGSIVRSADEAEDVVGEMRLSARKAQLHYTMGQGPVCKLDSDNTTEHGDYLRMAADPCPVCVRYIETGQEHW